MVFSLKRGLFILFFIISMLLIPTVPAKAHHDHARILVLNSYHRGYEWSDSILAGIEQTLLGWNDDVSVHVEYMDSKRVQGKDSFDRLAGFYSEKFRKDKFDLIISSDDPAFNFLMTYSAELFPSVPVFFCGVHEEDYMNVRGGRKSTGVMESIDIGSTLGVAFGLHPETEDVLVISDNTTSGSMHLKYFRSVEPDFSGYNFIVVDNTSMRELLGLVKNLPSNSFILFLSFSKDNEGRVFSLEQSLDMISNASPVPVYSSWDYMLGKGIVGGNLISGYLQGKEAAIMALEYLEGKPISSIPVMKESPNRLMFDYRQLERFGLKKSQLPKGSVVINKPVSVYKEHRRVINFFVVIVLLLGMVVMVLLMNVRKKRYAEAKLKEAMDGLEVAVADRTAALATLNLELQHEITERKEIEEKLQVKSGQLEILNKTLEEKVLEEIESRRQQEQILIQQSKLASMGEMVGAIAHQWRQPLSALGSIIQNIYDAYTFDSLDRDYIERSVDRSIKQINFMSKTIDDFRNFFTPEKEKTTFDVKFAIGEILSLLDAQLKNNYISYRLTCHAHHVSVDECADLIRCDDMITTTYKNEFEQVVLNLIRNATDAIMNRRQIGSLPHDVQGMIDFGFYQEDGHIIIRISDNGGGIPGNIMHRIFEPYFTTKEQGRGTGIGLYMSKIIVEQSMKGSLLAENNNEGAMFTIMLKKEIANEG
ncbi:MAG: hypothetical protein JSV21_12000 [Nitrospirota bacterium]|nr:MAG: hypothetical protein JSV21_12000 [Nitrospirota bacterium]